MVERSNQTERSRTWSWTLRFLGFAWKTSVRLRDAKFGRASSNGTFRRSFVGRLPQRGRIPGRTLIAQPDVTQNLLPCSVLSRMEFLRANGCSGACFKALSGSIPHPPQLKHSLQPQNESASRFTLSLHAQTHRTPSPTPHTAPHPFYSRYYSPSPTPLQSLPWSALPLQLSPRVPGTRCGSEEGGAWVLSRRRGISVEEVLVGRRKGAKDGPGCTFVMSAPEYPSNLSAISDISNSGSRGTPARLIRRSSIRASESGGGISIRTIVSSAHAHAHSEQPTNPLLQPPPERLINIPREVRRRKHHHCPSIAPDPIHLRQDLALHATRGLVVCSTA